MITFCMTQRETNKTKQINWPSVTAKFGQEKSVIRNMVRAWQDKMDKMDKMKNEGIVTNSTANNVDVNAHTLVDVEPTNNPLSNPVDSILDILLTLAPLSTHAYDGRHGLGLPDKPPLHAFSEVWCDVGVNDLPGLR